MNSPLSPMTHTIGYVVPDKSDDKRIILNKKKYNAFLRKGGKMILSLWYGWVKVGERFVTDIMYVPFA